MLRFRHIVLITMLICGSIAMLARGAPAPQIASHDDLANLPDVTAVVTAFATVRKWLDEFTVPSADSAPAKLNIANASGVCVILRRSGRVLGTGIDFTPDDLMLRRAVAQAMSQVLSDPALRRLLSRLDRDKTNTQADIDQLQREIGRSITIELEVAGKLVPLLGTSLSQMARKLEPGIHGAAIRYQDSWQFAFPANLRITNTAGEPDRALQNLVLMSSYPLNDIAKISQRHDAGLYSFRCITMTQAAADRTPYQTFRGDTIVPLVDVTPEAVRETADGIARHLIESMWPEPAKDESGNWIHAPQPLGFMGDYQIVSDEYKPLLGPPMEQALGALALSRYGQAPGVDRTRAASATQAALRALRDLAQVADGEDDPRANPLACAAIVLAAMEVETFRTDAAVRPLFEAASQTVVNSFSRDGRLLNALPNASERLSSPFAQALLACSLSRLLSTSSGTPIVLDHNTVRQALDNVWLSTPKQQHVALLPWIGWAEVDYARFTKRPLAHQDDFTALIDVLVKSQIDAHASTSSLDLDGGFPLLSDAAIGDAMALPTSQSLRPATWLAGLSAEPLYLPPAQMIEQLRSQQKRSMRFLVQLTVRDAYAATARNSRRCLGGVRQSLWSSTQPLAAQAMGLLAAAETLKSVNHSE